MPRCPVAVRSAAVAGAVFAATALSAPAGARPAGPLDPGPYAVRTIEYDAGLVEPIEAPAPLALARLRGTLYVPAAPGARAVVLFAHGRHATCRTPAREVLVWPCPGVPVVAEELPNWRGYG